MSNYKTDAFDVVGIDVRTTNENAQSVKDIGALWQTFISEGILDKIPNKIDNTIYCVYTDYESDHTKPYTTILGCKVSSVDTLPKEMMAKTIQAGEYTKFIAKGNLQEGILYQKWLNIFNTDLERTYDTDFEVFGEKAKNPTDAEVEIFVGIKQEK